MVLFISMVTKAVNTAILDNSNQKKKTNLIAKEDNSEPKQRCLDDGVICYNNCLATYLASPG